MTDTFTKEKLFKFKYSRISHFDFFKEENSDIELYGKNLSLEEDADPITYQNLLVYTYLKNKKNLNILQIGIENLRAFDQLKETHNCWKIDIENIINDLKEFDLISISESSEAKIQDPKAFFDLIFFSTSINTIPNDINIFSSLYSNIKYLLKANGIFIGTFTNIIYENSIWVNDMISFFNLKEKINNNGTSFSMIHKDPDLFVLSEHFYTEHWKKNTNKSYKEFGKPYCYNLFFENIEKIYPENFQNFAYSKKSHYKFYKDNRYSDDLGITESQDDISLDQYQSLLVFATIKSNLTKNARILQIGEAPEYLESKLKKDYNFFKLENPGVLSRVINFRDESTNNEIKCYKGNKIKDYSNCFDFIYFFPGNNKKDHNFIRDAVIFNNINNLLKLWGLCLFSAKSWVGDKTIYYPHLFNYLFLNNVFKFNKFIKPAEILSDEDAYMTKEMLYNILWTKIAYLPRVSVTKPNNNLTGKPVYVFHHLIKCGGTSMNAILQKWFRTVLDKIDAENLNTYILKKYDVNNFFNDTCLISHFQYEGIYLHQRYPEFLERNKEFRIFIVVRDPLALKTSLYYYVKQYSKIDYKGTLADSLMTGKNYIASLFPCDETNYKQVLDRYFFIGIMEKLQESLDKFADMTGKKREKIPLLNTTVKDSQVGELSPEFISKFKEWNSLDYKIYDYCLEKFEKLS